MGTLFIDNPVLDNPVARASQFDTLSSGTGMGTAFEDSLLGSPVASLNRMNEQGVAQRGEAVGPIGRAPPRRQPTTPLLSVDEAKDQLKASGLDGELSVTAPIRQGELDLLSKWKREELRRADILRRADPGIINGAGRLGAAFLGAAVDPINIASAFVPVVGEARFAYLAERLGMTGARFAAGAIEGAVGAGLVEPIIAMQAQNQQADYTAYDSLMNIAFGTVLGGGLHAGFGKFSDWIGGHSIDTRETALRGSLAAVAEDRPVHVAEVMKAMQPPPRVPIVEADQANIGKSITDFITGAEPANKQMLRVGQVTNETAARAAELGINISGFDHMMQTSDVLHTLKRHGEGAQLRGDEIPVTPDDIARVPDIIATADSVRAETTRQGLPALVFTKREGNTSIVVEEVRAGKKRLAFKSMRIKKAGGPGTSDAPGGLQTIRPDREPGTAANNLDADGLDFNTQSALPEPDEADPTAFREAVDAQKRAQQMQPDDQTLVNAIDGKSANFDQPITLETTAQEAADLIALADEGINHLKSEGLLDAADEAELKMGQDAVSEAKNRAAGIQAAAACFMRSV